MRPEPSRKLTRVEQVAEHLKSRGHISEGSSIIEYGRFRLSDAIYRLRTSRKDLIPDGMVIITIHKQDTQGNPYGEYHLVPEAARAAQAKLHEARSKEDPTAPL